MANWILLITFALFSGSYAFANDITTLRDPTTPLIGVGMGDMLNQNRVQTEDEFRLQAITNINGIKYAVIDGKSYKLGQEYKGLVVQNISRDRVKLAAKNGKDYKTLWLFVNRVNRNE